MEAKEKAKDLLEKMNVIHYIKIGGKNIDSRGLPVSMHNSQIKGCALVCVDEIIKALRKDVPTFELSKGFFSSVKKEIKKL